MKYKNHRITFDEGGLVKFDFTTDEIIEDLKDTLVSEYYESKLKEKKEMVYEAFVDRIKDDLKFYFKDIDF